eukprot:741935-Amphidinium_carterae.1
MPNTPKTKPPKLKDDVRWAADLQLMCHISSSSTDNAFHDRATTVMNFSFVALHDPSSHTTHFQHCGANTTQGWVTEQSQSTPC